MSLHGDPGNVSLVHSAFVRATSAAEKAMGELAAQGQQWKEEYITTEFCKTLVPEVRYTEFNRTQEGRVGADYIWWWVDRSGLCFGCLVQAKALKKRGTKWKIGFDNFSKTGDQMERLFRAADIFSIPAGYMLYAGDPAYRADMRCSFTQHDDVPCHLREGAGVTLIPALAVQQDVRTEALRATAPARKLLFLPETDALDAFHQAIPLIRLTHPDPCMSILSHRALRFDGNQHDLRRFLTTDQIGAAKVARLIFDVVGKIAFGQYETMTRPAVADPTPATVFSSYPGVRGHFGTPYFPHVLQGLRTQLPEYVERCLNGNVPPEVAEHADGIVVAPL
ncbi:hypothetical protein [Streptomyces sp. SID13726]|uniref:hypothetical protein n=1 Tax=Streptomyces sp. SID13726 TaxID=2706058 RepID=UPI0013BA9EF2|nr:hypothetical protein [Streptomyces sp. SID13726]NEB01893.1 hypothetical protein [Streptomyces sp. SID13726]